MILSLHLVILTSFFIISTMKKGNLMKHYTDLFTEYGEDSLFLKLQKKLNELLGSLELEDKDIILAISWWADSMVVASQVLYYFHINGLNLRTLTRFYHSSDDRERYMKLLWIFVTMKTGNIFDFWASFHLRLITFFHIDGNLIMKKNLT